MARAGDHLHEAAPLARTPLEYFSLWAFVGHSYAFYSVY